METWEEEEVVVMEKVVVVVVEQVVVVDLHSFCCLKDGLLPYGGTAQLHHLPFFHGAHNIALHESQTNVQRTVQH